MAVDRLPDGAKFDYESKCEALIWDRTLRAQFPRARWIVREGDYFTVARPELVLYEVTKTTKEEVHIRCAFSEHLTESPGQRDLVFSQTPELFAYEEFGPNRIWVPRYALRLSNGREGERAMEDGNW